MALDKPIDPTQLYQRWGVFNRTFAPGPLGLLLPGEGFPADMLSTGIISTLSLITGRQELWATTCLSTGYASRSDTDPGSVMFELAAATGQWRDSSLGQFSASYDNLGWDSQVLIRGARVLVAAVPNPLLALAGITIADIQVCFDTYGDDMDAVAECIRTAAGTRARLGW